MAAVSPIFTALPQRATPQTATGLTPRLGCCCPVAPSTERQLAAESEVRYEAEVSELYSELTQTGLGLPIFTILAEWTGRSQWPVLYCPVILYMERRDMSVQKVEPGWQ